MFDSLFPKHWTTLQRLMWLKTNALARAVYETVTGNPVSFTAKAAPLRKLKVAFSPVQSLNGYDSPWPAGGGKNKYSDVWLEYTKPYEYYVCPITLEQGNWVLSGELTGTAITGCVVGIVKAGTKYSEFVALRTALNVSGETATHSLSVDSTWTDPHLVIYCTGETQFNSLFSNYHFQLEKSSTASSYAPYSNICPILGWDSLNVEQRGKNLLQLTGRRIVTSGAWSRTTPRDFSEPSAFIGISMDGYFYNGYIADYSITGDSVSVNTSTGGFGVGLSSEVEPNTQYTVGYDNNQPAYMGIGYYDADGANMSYHSIDSPTKWTFTTPADCKYIVVVFRPQTYNELISYAKPMLVKGDTMPTYVPYNGRSISISLGSTVYSGWVDVVTGVGEVTMASVDLGTLGWGYSSADLRFYYTGLDYKRPPSGNVPANAICSSYPIVSFGALTDKTIAPYSNGYIYAKDTSYTDAATFKTAMSGVQLVYELATPIPISLTPQEVQSLAGDNTMWTDAQNLEVTYRSN